MTKCIKCGKELKLGKFAYMQNICWSCFCKIVGDIYEKCETAEQREVTEHMFRITKQMFNEQEHFNEHNNSR